MNLYFNEQIFQSFPCLESKRLRFREFKLQDSALLYSIRSNKKIMKYMDSPLYKEEKEAVEAIHTNKNAFYKAQGINWIIEEKTSQKAIGYFSYWRIDKKNNRAELGYALHSDYWGKGFMSETFKLLIDFAFKNMQVHSLEANTNTSNETSIRLLKKFGFKQEAHFKENYFFEGRFIDSLIFSLLEPKK